MKKLIIIMMTAVLSAPGAWAAEEGQGSTQEDDREIEASSLEELLDMVEQGRVVNRQEIARREQEFINNRDEQQRELERARRLQEEEEARAERLEAQFEENERLIAELEEQLSSRLGSLRELFGVLQQVAGDTQGVIGNSIISAEFPGREQWLSDFAQSMGRSSKLASIEEIERLWSILQKQMTESGKISRFNTEVIKLNGETVEQEVVRIGTFNLVSGGEYVSYDTENDIVAELPRQPAGRYVQTVANLANATEGFTPTALDPTRGQLLALQVQVPTLEERIKQGGTPGYVVIFLGIIAGLLAIYKFVTLAVINAKVRRQMNNSTPDSGNPLGRVLGVYHKNKDVDPETLQLKLDEAILKEQPSINSWIPFIKIISMVAPLLGLLGTGHPV
ncbi:MAG: MotA/TolQ/ExbB proton channel family protein [Desulfurivibrio sp.]|nr:MotA/TolQ/ExbB proton channel family protein [Desulfurivibrio sp.]